MSKLSKVNGGVPSEQMALPHSFLDRLHNIADVLSGMDYTPKDLAEVTAPDTFYLLQRVADLEQRLTNVTELLEQKAIGNEPNRDAATRPHARRRPRRNSKAGG